MVQFDFLLVCNSNYRSKSHRLGVITTQKKFSYLLSLGPNFDKFRSENLTNWAQLIFWTRKSTVMSFLRHCLKNNDLQMLAGQIGECSRISLESAANEAACRYSCFRSTSLICISPYRHLYIYRYMEIKHGLHSAVCTYLVQCTRAVFAYLYASLYSTTLH